MLILEHPYLAVKALGEWALFQIVYNYTQQHEGVNITGMAP